MLSSLTKSIRQKLRPAGQSPGLAARTISFPEHEQYPSTEPRKSSYHYPRKTARRLSEGEELIYDEEEQEQEEQEESGDNGNDISPVTLEADDDEESSDHTAEEQSPLLPIFSSDHLNVLPVFSLTHIFREMVIERCDTVLTWDQLRSPQVSQFLVKPVQQDIKEHYMNAATQYALLANCLQFTKEAGTNPGNSGTNKTRALLCELIAIKLLRECSTRQLIDALSYDFDPLQGQSPNDPMRSSLQRRLSTRAARISCLEVAIRAGAKRFLAHPLVVKHLEAIWNGAIVFHSAADSMHRRRTPLFQSNYGTNARSSSVAPRSPGNNRTASLYNPREASLFKLSRLRVPRYRNILSTISFAILLLLFMAVLQERSLEVSYLEVLFWIWATGYMLDEVIGFNEQGFSLYLASFWNTFDVGIIVLLFVQLCLRLYGIFLPEDDPAKGHVADRAYDVLAASAVLLFPRLFSVLDHYRYFSQLIIAFRMMAADMLAVFVLIIIFCSGFLVALTFAFTSGKTDDPKDVAYALLQMLMGFTPAAWDRWDEYNWLGKTVLTLFLFICHFVVVTILITVLTNSFMAIVQNANEEHQYLFAINVISNVKSDALFAYVPPLNVLQWLLTPLRYVLPFRQYLKVNRTIIKVTHLPILWTIFFYEKFILRRRYIDTTDLVERGRLRKTLSQRLPRLVREPSIATFRQDAALDEVFRGTLRATRSQERHKSSTAVHNWMGNIDEDHVEPPQEQDRHIVDRLERRRFGSRRLHPSHIRDFSISRHATSVLSDPHDLASHTDFFSPRGHILPAVDLTPTGLDLPSQQTDADGDDELATNDEDNETNIGDSGARSKVLHHSRQHSLRRNFFSNKITSDVTASAQEDSDAISTLNPAIRPGKINQSSYRYDERPRHARNTSSATMIYKPPPGSVEPDEPSPRDVSASFRKRPTFGTETASTPPSSKLSTEPTERRTPKRQPDQARPRPTLPTKDNVAFRSTPDISNVFARSKPTNIPNASPGRRKSSLEIDLISDIGDNKAIGGGYVGALPASFASQMAHATNALRESQLRARENEQRMREQDNEMIGKIVMQRMTTLEEGFREVVHEVRESMKQATSGLASRQRSPERDVFVPKRQREKRFRERQERSNLTSGSTSIISKEEFERPRTGGSGSASGKEKSLDGKIEGEAGKELHRPETLISLAPEGEETLSPKTVKSAEGSS